VVRYRNVSESKPESKQVIVGYDTTYTILPAYTEINPIFPIDTHESLAILPFTTSTDNSAVGIEIAEEIEYALLSVNRDQPYKIVNRTQLSEILQEKVLENTGFITSEEIMNTRKILSIDGLITGHVSAKNDSYIRFFLKAIDTKDASIVYNNRYEGMIDNCMNEITDLFYLNRIQSGFDTTYIYDPIMGNKTVYTRHTVQRPYTTRVPDKGKNAVLYLLLSAGIIVALIASSK